MKKNNFYRKGSRLFNYNKHEFCSSCLNNCFDNCPVKRGNFYENKEDFDMKRNARKFQRNKV